MVDLWRQTTSQNVQAVMATFREETEMTALWVPKVTKKNEKNSSRLEGQCYGAKVFNKIYNIYNNKYNIRFWHRARNFEMTSIGWRKTFLASWGELILLFHHRFHDYLFHHQLHPSYVSLNVEDFNLQCSIIRVTLRRANKLIIYYMQLLAEQKFTRNLI